MLCGLETACESYIITNTLKKNSYYSFNRIIKKGVLDFKLTNFVQLI